MRALTERYSGAGNNTWPLSYLMFTCLTKADTPYDGCAPITTIFALLTWSELNNQVPAPTSSCALNARSG